MWLTPQSLRQPKYDEAIADYNKIIERSPVIENYLQRGLIYNKKGDSDKANTDFTRAIELDPKSVHTYNFICWYNSLLGQADQYMEMCEKAVELAPDNGTVRDSRGLALALMDDFDGAIEDFKLYVEWSKEYGFYEEDGTKREAWIEQLEAGSSPFDQEILDALWDE